MEKIIRYVELKKIVGGLTRITLMRLEKVGKFPKRVKIGQRSIGWRESDIENWLNNI